MERSTVNASQSAKENRVCLDKLKEEIKNDHAIRLSELQKRNKQREHESNVLYNNLLDSHLMITKVVSLGKLRDKGYNLYKPQELPRPIYCPYDLYTADVAAKANPSNLEVIDVNIYDTEQNFRMLEFFTKKFDKYVAILRYIGTLGRPRAFPRYLHFFQLDTKYYVFHERFHANQGYSLAAHVASGNNVKANIKDWLLQLADGVEMLNTAGIAHRFIRAESVIVYGQDSHLVRLGEFESACIFWNANDKRVQLQKRAWLEAVNKEYYETMLDHLPPEVAKEPYDASQVDVWSIGVLALYLLTQSSVFRLAINPESYYHEWRLSQVRALVPEHFRALLDDIFTVPSQRLTCYDLKRDKRLRYPSHILAKIVLPRFYRIEDNLNIQGSPHQSHTSSMRLVRDVDAKTLLKLEHIHKLGDLPLRKDEDLIALGYEIRRNDTFKPELVYLFENDNYIMVMRDTPQGKKNAMVRIFLPETSSARMKSLLNVESSRIMRYLIKESSPCAELFTLLQIIRTNKRWYFFYEDLSKTCGYRSLQQFYAPGTNNAATQANVSIERVHKWMVKLAQLVEYLNLDLGVAHRYIRAEYVFVCETTDTIRLTHFDMCCFIWNTTLRKKARRKKGLEDGCDKMWDHLPPECHSDEYDASGVDVWSLGVLLAYCLVEGRALPFQQCKHMSTVSSQWNEFKTTNLDLSAECVTPYVYLLELIFVHPSTRLDANQLISALDKLLVKSVPKLLESNKKIRSPGLYTQTGSCKDNFCKATSCMTPTPRKEVCHSPQDNDARVGRHNNLSCSLNSFRKMRLKALKKKSPKT